MMTLLLAASLAFASDPAASPAATESAAPASVRARVVSWDLGFKPKTLEAWIARVDSELASAIASGAQLIVFPELFAWGIDPYKTPGSDEPSALYITRKWREAVLPELEQRLKGKDVFVVLGSYPHMEPGWSHTLNRATLWYEGAWRFVDKLDPTQGELREDPPIRGGSELTLFPFKGGKAAVLVCYSVEMPEIAARLKAEGVQLLLVPSATEDEIGAQRVLRTASARAVELGAAVLVSPLTGSQGTWRNVGSAAMYLPSQKELPAGKEAPRKSSGIHREDFELPWARVLALRENPKHEVRPFLKPAAEFSLRVAP